MRVGDIVDGKYRVDRQIGEGGMGEVLEVTHIKLGNKVAIKVVRDAALSSPGIADRFLREAKAASNLKSDHVCRVIDVDELPSGAPYMVMELLQGRDLEKIIMQGPLQIPVAVDYILQAAEALAEAHAHGMVHRDIKPANLFVAERPNGTTILKVLDFGIATAHGGEVSSLTSTNMVMGSPQFMSPEQLRSSKVVDGRADIWALGVTLYVLLACRLPFDGKVFSELSIQIATEPHLRLNFVPPELADIIDKCMAKSPDARYGNVAELAFALAPFTSNGTAAAQRAQSLLAGGSGAYPPLQTGPQASSTPLPVGAQSIPGGGLGHAATQATGSGFVPGKPTTLGASAAQMQAQPVRKGSPLKWIAPLVLVGGGAGAAFVVTRSSETPEPPKPPITQTAATNPRLDPPDAPAADPGPGSAEAALAPTPIALTFEPANTKITIDGTPYPNPLDALVPLKPHKGDNNKLVATAEGYEPYVATLSPGGERNPLVIKLPPLKKTRPNETVSTKAETKTETKTVEKADPKTTKTEPKNDSKVFTGDKGKLITDPWGTPPSDSPKK